MNNTKLQQSFSITEFIRSYGTILASLLIIIGFSILSPNAFATFDNLINISRQISFLVIIALGATLVMAIKEFDLSIGAMASLGGVIAAKLATFGVPIFFCFLIPVIVGLIIGFINGWIVSKFKVLSFVTTLAMGTILGGFTFWFTGGTTIFENIPPSFRYIGQSQLLAIPLLSITMILIAIIFWYVMNHMTYGRKLYAIGGNEKASNLAGINVKFNKNMAFALCAALAALTGALMASRLGSAHPTGGDGLFLNAYAAVFLGMTAFKQGVPNIWGTFLGAVILGILANGLTILSVPTFMQDVVTGLIIIAALILQKLGRETR